MREEITKIQMGERVFVNTFVNNAASSMAGPSGKPSVDNDDGDALRSMRQSLFCATAEIPPGGTAL